MPAEEKMRLASIIITIIIFSGSLRAEKLTVYTYDSFVSEWGPGPIIEKVFEDKNEIDLQFIAVDSAATLLNKIILEGENTKAEGVPPVVGWLTPKATRFLMTI